MKTKIWFKSFLTLILASALSGCGFLQGGVEEVLSSSSLDLNLLKVSGDILSIDINEGSTPVIFYSLSKARTTATVVTVSLTSVRGDQGTVFSSVPATFTIAAGSTTGLLSLTSVHNPVYTGDLDFSLQVSTSASDVTVSAAALTINVKDLESMPVLALSAGALNVNEASGAGTTTVSMSPASAYPVTVAYSFPAGTATNTSDYTASSGTVTFAPGDTSKTIPFTIVEDVALESTENFSIALGSVTGQATVSATLNTKTVNIIDNDTTTLVIDDVTVDEGNNLVFTVTLAPAVGSTVTVDYATANGTALSGTHYTAASNTLTFTAGQTTKTITIPSTALPAEICHADRDFTVGLSNPTNAAIAISTGTGTIRDPDLPSLSVAAASGTEGSSISLAASLSAACSTKNVTFTWGTSAGTATSGTDYVAISGATGSITAGNTTTNLTVTSTDDAVYEGDETFTVNISAPTNATIGTASATGTIQDNETAPTVQWTAASFSGNESSGTITVTAQLSTVSAVNVTVPFTVTGTATVTSDYTITASPITILAGSTTATATITLIDDAVVESDETVILTIGSPTNATASGTTVHTATILNDDIANFTISGIQGFGAGPDIDTTTDAYLNYETRPKIIFAAASGATSYDVTVYASDGTTVVCALQNTASTSFSPSSCTLTAGSSYKAKVTAKNASSVTKDATNSLYDFTYNRTPVAVGDSVMMMYDGAAVVFNPRANDTDADSDSLTISAVGSPTYGTLTTDGTNLTYTPNGTYYGSITVSYTISDGKGAASSANETINLMTPYTWTGAGAGTRVWNDAANWCGSIASPGLSGVCSGSVGYPSDKTNSAHFAVFNSTVCTSGACAAAVINAATQAYSIYMMTGNVTNITQSAGVGNTIDIGAGGLTMRGGNFTGNNAAISISGTNTGALLGYFAGTFKSTSSTLTITCSGATGTVCWDAGGGVFQNNSGTVIIQGDSTGSKIHRLNWASTSAAGDRPVFNNLKLQSVGGAVGDVATFATYNTGSVYTVGSARNYEIGAASGSGRVEFSGGSGGGSFYLSFGSGTGSVLATNGSLGGNKTLNLSPYSSGTATYGSTGDGILSGLEVSGVVSASTTDVKLVSLRVTGSGSSMFTFPSGILNFVATKSVTTSTVRFDSGLYNNNNGTLKYTVDSSANPSADVKLYLQSYCTSGDCNVYLNNLIFECSGATSANKCDMSYTDANSTVTDKMIVAGNVTISEVSGERYFGPAATMEVQGNVTMDGVLSSIWTINGTGTLTMNGTGNQTFTSINSGRSAWQIINVNKPTAGTFMDFSGSYRNGWYAPSMYIQAGTVRANGNTVLFDDFTAGWTGVLNISAGATLDMGGGTLTYESLVNNGTLIP